ncbi:prohibitin family protein [Amantichitinum ursilacus]|uniref:Modulator of FtsH protease HflK n=1 Tax=Amantichitinum ursilacus TaxID=857265 RepID=A0A0N0GQS5_9NEIS|nr:prohibitin family protein [Amantichitinum ursilacus]KPC55160.1 Modulator of FtsH protease HflK [Amantichitinum ursilacus]
MQDKLTRNALKIVAVLIVLYVLLASFYTVTQGERGIVFRFGQIQSVESEGLHFKLPMVDSVVKVDVRTVKADAPTTASTRDLQNVTTKVALNYHLDATALKDTYSRFGLDVEEKLIDPRIQETTKAVTARFSAEELLSRRDDVRSEIANNLRTSLRSYNIVVEDIQITDFHFSASFDHAIEAKQVAEQQAQKANNDLARIKIEAEQKIAMAQAEAQTIKIQANAIREQGGQEYVQLKAIEKWNGELPQVAGANTPFINLNSAQK